MQICSRINLVFSLRVLILYTFILFSFSPAYAQNGSQAQEPWEGAYSTQAFAGGVIRNIYCDLAQEVEGSFGAMVFIVGGIVAFSTAVFGNPKRMYSIVMAGIVGATITTGVSLSFGKMCTFGDAGAGAKTAKSFESVVEETTPDIEADNSLF